MKSLSGRIDHNLFIMHGIFNTYVKVENETYGPPEASEPLAFMLAATTYVTKELITIQTAIRKPNSIKMKYTRHQRIGVEFLYNKMIKYRGAIQ